MTAKQKLHQAKLAEWAARFADHQASGLTIRQWCEQNNISFHKYNYWKHLLKEEAVDQILPDIVPLPVPKSLPSQGSALPGNAPFASFNPDRVNRANRANRPNFTNSSVRLCVDGVSLELDPSIPEDFLRTLIRAVHYA